jgi:hypothetical protein
VSILVLSVIALIGLVMMHGLAIYCLSHLLWEIVNDYIAPSP